MPSSDFPVSAIADPLRVGGKWFRSGDSAEIIKAVTFGPFPAGSFPDEGRSQLRRIREELGANAVRLYDIPSLPFLHDCAEVGLRAFIGLPWAQHIDFLSKRNVLADADRLLLDTIARFRGHPAVAGYFVGNEIDSTLVRWMGMSGVAEQIERLIDLGHANDPDALFAYANYPSTEYLAPQNQDFTAFNLYLETPEAFSSYLARLQVISGDKPLFLTEFGIDAASHGEEAQAEMLEWAVREAAAAGVAGMTLFSWSDLWQRGGKTVTGWRFGLTREDLSARPAVARVREVWDGLKQPADGITLTFTPKISVIVCTYRGSATLVPCLDSITALDYPDYEVIVVNDGSDERVAEIAASFNGVLSIATPHEGLGAARNTGARAATGSILAYTDDDCIVERDWLRWIAFAFQQDPAIGAAGGPNLPPPPENAVRAEVAAAPGGPSHVLLTDRRAEHLPGCNFAVRREAFEKIGGFNTIFRAAGDDVDFCWRLLEAGYPLGFSAPAFVWHYRRFSYRAYLKQQIGYGKAEALLMPLHHERFRGVGGAVWEGQVYVKRRRFGSIVYHGHYGHEPFQIVYPGGDSWFGEVALHVFWWMTILLFLILGFVEKGFFIPAAVLFLTTVWVALGRAGRSAIAPAFDTTGSRIALAGLILVQGVVRSATRIWRGWRHANWTKSLQFVSGTAANRILSGWWKLGIDQAFWSEAGIDREELLAAILKAYPTATDDPTGKTDIVLRRGRLWNWAILTATEYHENEGRLTRLRLLARPEPLMRMITLPIFLGIPIAVGVGFGFKSEIVTLTLIYLLVWIASRLFMCQKLRMLKVARDVGLEPV